MKRSYSIMLALLLLFGAKSAIAAIRFELLDRNTVLARLRSCPKNDVDRQAQLATYFGEVGCTGPALTLDAARHSKFANVICTLPGSSPEKIVVGAHFDHAERGSGAVDNWSGASLLPSLYQALAATPRKHTFVFVGFWGEERGLLGSQQYVRKLGKEDLANIDAMVNMDTFAAGPTEFWVGHSDPMLENAAVAVASAMKLPIEGLRLENVSTDSETFRGKKIPSIEFCALTQSTPASAPLTRGPGFRNQRRRLLQRVSPVGCLSRLHRPSGAKPHRDREVDRRFPVISKLLPHPREGHAGVGHPTC